MSASAYLVVDVGTLHTRVTLVDNVEGITRLVGHVSVASSHIPPARHVLFAIIEAAATLSDMTGRLLVRDGRLLMPQSDSLDGIDQLIVTSSAAGVMRVTVIALARDVSAAAVLQALAGGPYILGRLVSLDRPDGRGADDEWFARQAAVLLAEPSDCIVLAGGLDDGAADGVLRLTQLVALTNAAPFVAESRPVIFAGNAAARVAVRDLLGQRMPLQVTDNVQPTLEQRRLEPLRRVLAEHYQRTNLARLPGVAALEQAGLPAPQTTERAQQLMTRFLSQHLGRSVALVDCGAAAVRYFAAQGDQHVDIVLSEHGLAHGLPGVLAAVGAERLLQWLPFAFTAAELTDWILNRRVRPSTLSLQLRDVLIELAATREALRLAAAAAQQEQPALRADWIIAAGGLLSALREPGLALMAVLDGLQPADAPSALCEVHLDRFHLLAACGALAEHDPVAAVDLFEHDLLTNVPLATVIVPQGHGKPGARALDVELVPVDGPPQRRTVHFGELVRLPLPIGSSAQVRVLPSSTVRLAAAAVGEPLESDPAEVRGSVLGLVIDMRGRPLSLPDDPLQRRAQLRAWLAVLGIEVTDENIRAEPLSLPQSREQTSGRDFDELPPLLQGSVEALRRNVTRRRRVTDE